MLTPGPPLRKLSDTPVENPSLAAQPAPRRRKSPDKALSRELPANRRTIDISIASVKALAIK